MRFPVLLLSVVTATAALSGCGGSSDSDPTQTLPPSAQSKDAAGAKRYIAEAESVCRRSNEAIHALGGQLSEETDTPQTATSVVANGLIRPGIAILDERYARLRAIEPAPAAPDLEIYLGFYNPIIELSRQLLEATEASDGPRSKALELTIADLGEEQADAGHAFGFDSCALTFTDALGGMK